MSRWNERDDVARGDDYDARWRALAAAGESIHGEADLVGAQVTAGLVACGAHQQHYSVADGAQIESNQKLERLPVEIVGGRAFVMMPDDDPTERPARLLATDRDDTWPNGIQRSTGR